jgi:hypothetical protein
MNEGDTVPSSESPGCGNAPRSIATSAFASAFVAPVTAALPPQIEAARIAAIVIEPPLTAAERIALVKRQMRALFR